MGSSAPASPHPIRHSLVVAIVVALVTFAIYSPLLGAHFTAWDDPATLTQNPNLHPPTLGHVADYWTTAGEAAPMGLYVPVTYTVWSIASLPDGPRPAVIHAVNVAVHSMTAGLVFLLLRRFAAPVPALIGAGLFALHPLQVEAVGWASGTKDLLCGFFAVLVLLIETTPGRSRGMRTVAFGCFALATLSKPTAMVVPLMLIAFDVFRSTGVPPAPGASDTHRAPALRRILMTRLPWILLGIACGIWTAASQPVPWQPTLPLWTRPVVALDAVAFYVGKLIWPARLCIDYGRRPDALFHSPAVFWTWVIPVAIAGLLMTRRGRRFRLAAGWFVVPLLPLLGFLPFDFQYFSTVADHYLYLPMVGVALAVAVALPARMPWKILVPIGAGFAGLAVLTIRQERVWFDTRSLAGQAVAVSPGTFAGHDLLGYDRFIAARLAVERGSTVEARADFAAAISQYRQALAGNPVYAPSMTNLAMAQHQAGRAKDALETLHRLVALQPALPARMRSDPRRIGVMLRDYGDPAGAARWMADYVRGHPAEAGQTGLPGG